MATVRLPHRARRVQPRHPIRQGLIVAVLVLAGIGVGLLLDSGRSLSTADDNGSVPAPAVAGLTPAQPLAALADMLAVRQQPAALDTRGATYNPALGGVVYGAAAVEGLTPAQRRLEALADMLVVRQQPAALDTRGATYNPALGGVVYR